MIEYVKCKKIVGGIGTGRIVYTKHPLNFLSSVDTHTGVVSDPSHHLIGISLKNSILIFPYAIGSSVGAYSIFALKSNGVAPSGINTDHQGGYHYCIRMCYSRHTVSPNH